MEKRIKTFGKTAVVAAVIAGVVVTWRFLSTPDKNIIGVIPQYNSSEFQRIQKGIESEAEKNGYELIVKIPEEMTVQAQRKAMRELMEEGADCILIESIAEGGFVDVLEECSSQEIPVLSYNSRVNASNVYAEVLPYPIESAAEAILASMEDHINASGQFSVLSSTSQDYLREARTREMLVSLENGTYPDLHFTGSGFVKEDEELVAEKAEQLQKKYPDLEYLVCYSTLDACGVAQYIEESGVAWKMICEASLDDFGSIAPEGTVALTYDYKRYGRFLAELAVSAVEAKSVPVPGDIFEWEDDRTYVFKEKWGWNGSESNPSAENGEICSITMQEKPDVMVRVDGKWE